MKGRIRRQSHRLLILSRRFLPIPYSRLLEVCQPPSNAETQSDGIQRATFHPLSTRLQAPSECELERAEHSMDNRFYQETERRCHDRSI